ncbi:MAG: type 1 glutamine amidotransferase [Pseudomonadota bacterium]
MRIGILETGKLLPAIEAEHGDYSTLFARLFHAVDPEIGFTTFAVVDGQLPAGPDEADGWLITGSRHGVYDDLPWMEPLKTFLRAAVAAGRPVVGICFGHQILAEAMGGRVEKSDRGWGCGVQDYQVVEAAPWMQGAEGTFSTLAMHQDQVVDLPPEARVLAGSDFCPYAALAYGDPAAPGAVSVQFHPEFTPALDGALIELRRGDAIPEAVASPALASLARRTDHLVWADWIVQYLRQATARKSAA